MAAHDVPVPPAATIGDRVEAIDSVTADAYTVATDSAEADGTAAWDATTIVVVTVHAGGQEGTGWTYGPSTYAAFVDRVLRPLVVGRDPMSIPGIWLAMARGVRNATRAGAAAYAISAVDVACWDLKAKLLGLALPDLFGRVWDTVPVYGSGGFTSYDDDQLTRQLDRWVAHEGIPRVKIKIGESRGSRIQRDIERTRSARATIGPDTALYVDANGAYGRKQAVRYLRSVADCDVTWFEEPVTSDDLDGLRVVRDQVDADVTAGEYGTGIYYFEQMCGAGAVDCLQIDVTRCGGYTEWLRSAAVAASHGLDVSAHCAPYLHAPVAQATPNVRHLEWFHDHVRIIEKLFRGTTAPTGGVVRPSDDIGHGFTLDTDAAEPFRVVA